MSRFRAIWRASIDATKKALTWSNDDLMPPTEKYIYKFNSKEELKRWHLYSDSEYGGLSSASLEIKDTGNGSTGVFSGNLSLDVTEDSKWKINRSGFCGMRSKKVHLSDSYAIEQDVPWATDATKKYVSSVSYRHPTAAFGFLARDLPGAYSEIVGPSTPLNCCSWFDGYIDLDAYDTLAMKLKGDGRCYISTIYTENWVNSPGQQEDNSWQAFVFIPKNDWYITKIPLERYLPTWRGNVIDAKMEMNPSRIVGMSLSVNAEGGFRDAKSGPGDFNVEIDWIKALRTGN